MIKHVKFASIPVKDSERARDFYVEKLGFTLHTDAPFGDGRRWIELSPPGAETRVVLFTPDGHEDRVGTFSNVTFACDDVEASYNELRARGVEFTQPPTTQPWGTFAMFNDSEGNQFVMSSAFD
ncbi:MAG TPA: VOC family protein [Candidatus Kapabacteria bacterium]|nr:VOC family protein [Candidatus Kapabacteria bacterium]